MLTNVSSPESLDKVKNKSNYSFIKMDISNLDIFSNIINDFSPNYIIHLAAETGNGQSMYEISRYNRVNIIGTSYLYKIYVTVLSN